MIWKKKSKEGKKEEGEKKTAWLDEYIFIIGPIAVILLAIALVLYYFFCLPSLAHPADSSESYTVLTTGPNTIVYLVGDPENPWAKIHFPEKGGMILKFDKDGREISFPEESLCRNVAINKGFLEGQGVILTKNEIKDTEGKTHYSYSINSPD